MIIMVNVIGCETVYILNLLIIFPLIIQRRRKLRVSAAFVLYAIFRRLKVALNEKFNGWLAQNDSNFLK